MLFPERMAKISLLFHKDDLYTLNSFLAEKGVIHISESSKAEEFKEYDVADLKKKIFDIEKLLSTILEHTSLEMRIKKVNFFTPDFSLEAEVDRIRDELKDIYSEIEYLNREKGELYFELMEVIYAIEYLEHIKHVEMDLDELKNIGATLAVIGRIPDENIEPLKESLAKYPHKLFVFPTPPIHSFHFSNVFIATDFENYDSVKSVALSLGLRENKALTTQTGPVMVVLEQLNQKRWALQEGIIDVGVQMNNIKEKLSDTLPAVSYKIEAIKKMLDVFSKFKRLNNLLMLSGFLPANELNFFAQELKKRYNDRVVLLVDRDSAISDDVLAPTKYRHPFWLKPFELFVNTYGMPSYNELDPTPAFFLTFLFMFGIMFGDIGHGAILLLLGIGLLSLRVKKLFHFAGVLVWAGIASVVFGFLFGSVFGKEDVVKPLLFHPIERINTFLVIGIIIGVFIVSLGVFLNFVNLSYRKELKELVFGKWGILSGMFYWLTLAFIVALLRNSSFFNWKVYAVIAGGLMVAIILKDLIIREHGESSLAESAFEVVDIIMSYFSNTVSFIRVAAFGLNHAALMLAIFQISALMPQSTSFVDQAVGNIFVVVLEGLIVTIQIMRLEFYEFFSKFYKGEGYKYSPYKV